MEQEKLLKNQIYSIPVDSLKFDLKDKNKTETIQEFFHKELMNRMGIANGIKAFEINEFVDENE